MAAMRQLRGAARTRSVLLLSVMAPARRGVRIRVAGEAVTTTALAGALAWAVDWGIRKVMLLTGPKNLL